MVRHSGAWLTASAIVTVGCFGCAKEKPKPAQISPPEEVTFVTSDSAHLVGTWQSVQNSRAAVICVPTVGFTRASWSTTMQRLANAGWSVLSFDLRGEGDSGIPPGSTWTWLTQDSASSIEHYVQDIGAAIQFVRSTAGQNVKVILVGADVAGVAALYAATAEPAVAGVTLFTPPGDLDKLTAGGFTARYGDRPLMIMTEQPISGTQGTPRTLDSWLDTGRGSVITLRLGAPSETTTLDNKQAALNKLLRWIESATL